MGITALVFSKIPALLAMSGKDIALLVVCGLAIIFLIALVAVSFRLNIIRKRAEAEEKHADKVKIVKGVRYSEESIRRSRRADRKKISSSVSEDLSKTSRTGTAWCWRKARKLPPYPLR